MNLDQIFNQLKPICRLLGVILIIVAALQLFNLVHIGFGGDVSANALVGIGLLHV